MIIGNKQFDTKNKTYLMGILNVTPDSFSDGGRYHFLDRALQRVEEMIIEGADLIDIGGESTRPGYTKITAEEEIERVLPVIEAVKKNFSIPVSLDTYKSEVAKAGIEGGVDLINDIWGLLYDENMAPVIAGAGIACCLMHNRPDRAYRNLCTDILGDLNKSIEAALHAGISKEKIILDPGIGFAKDTEENLRVLHYLSEIKNLGYPLLLGVSRKSVIGNTLQLPVEERLHGTIAVNVYGCLQGCAFLRVHDVKAHKEAIKMIEAIRNMGEMRL